MELRGNQGELRQHQLDRVGKHIKNAWVAGIISAVFTIIFAVIGANVDEIRYRYGLDSWSLIDAALILALTYGIYRKKRFAALSMLLYFILSKLVLLGISGEISGGIVSILFGYFFVMGTLSTFRLHNHQIAIGEKEKRNRGASVIVLVSIGLIILAGFLGLIVVGSMGPSTEVLPGKQLKNEYTNFIYNHQIIDSDEVIHYWYSDAFIDFKEGFYFYTDLRVVVYNSQWEEPAIIMPFLSIIDIEFERDESFINDSRILLYLDDDTMVFFPVSSENNGDLLFYDKLIEIWERFHPSDKISMSNYPRY